MYTRMAQTFVRSSIAVDCPLQQAGTIRRNTPQGLMTWQGLLKLAAVAGLEGDSTAIGSASSMVAALCTTMMAARQQLLTGAAACGSGVRACQVCEFFLQTDVAFKEVNKTC